MAATNQDLSDEQLIHRVFESERELVQARFRHSMNQLENTAKLKQLRREIAKLKTETRTREVAQGLSKGALVHTHRQSFGGQAAVSEGAPEQKGGFLSGIVDKLSGKE